MKEDTIFAVIDFETFSEADLKSVGAFEYSKHPSTEILVVAWKIGTRKELSEGRGKTGVYFPYEWDIGYTSDFKTFLQIMLDGNIKLVAHNAFFEQCISRNIFAERLMYSKEHELKEKLKPSRFIDTMAQAKMMSFPGRLELAAKHAGLKNQKDMEGNRLTLKWAKPRKPTKHNPSTRHDCPKEFKRIVEYCIRDIEVEVELFCKLPMLPKSEQRLWVLDQQINMRGVKVDRKMVKKLLSLIDEEESRLLGEIKEETYGEIDSLNKFDAILSYFESEGHKLPNFDKEAVAKALENEDIVGTPRRILEIRQELGQSSLKKLPKFESQSRFDGRLRGQFVYSGAAQTGRWAGRDCQLQNLYRPNIKGREYDFFCDVFKKEDAATIYQLYGSILKTMPSAIRGCIVAEKGHVLHVADYNAIEPRVLFWLSGEEEGLSAFRDKRPIYEEMAAMIFNNSLTGIQELGKESFERFIGKQSVIGFGYQMGAPTFCKQNEKLIGRPIPKNLGERAKTSYRAKYKKVVKLWAALEKAAIAAVQRPGTPFETNMVTYIVEGDFLRCYLPSGRAIAYHRPHVKYEEAPWGDMMPKLCFYGESKVSWVRMTTYGGSLAENITQAVSRDLLANAMFNVRKEGFKPVLHAHDELGSESKIGSGLTQEFYESLMLDLPRWAEGLPVAVEGYEAVRYRK